MADIFVGLVLVLVSFMLALPLAYLTVKVTVEIVGSKTVEVFIGPVATTIGESIDGACTSI